MARRHGTGAGARFALVSATALALILAVSGSVPVPATAPAPAAAQAPSVLGICPTLEYTSKDPVEGKLCVEELQKALRKHGYEQDVTGYFGGQTLKNVQDFQRRHKIEAKGRVGPQTRSALLDDRAGGLDSVLPEVPLGSYISGPCTYEKCSLYLSRSTTRQYAALLGSHTSVAVSNAILTGACGKLLGGGLTTIVCGLAADGYATPIQKNLAAAAQQDACLRLTVRLGSQGSAETLEFAIDGTSRCTR
jgi:peptidoglycan hydrolase-like protein with peptidoglycan-binding domain